MRTLSLVVLSMLVAGCGESPQPPVKKAAPRPTLAPIKPAKQPPVEAPKVTESILTKLDGTEDVFDLYEMRESLQDSPEDSELLKSKFDEVCSELEPVWNVTDYLDFYQSKFTKEGEEEYRLFFLFKLKNKFEIDCRIHVHGMVEENNKHLLIREKATDSEYWPIQPDPPTTEWEPGEFHVVSHSIRARPIPYKVRFLLLAQPPGGRVSPTVRLGWVDFGKLESE